MYKSFSSSFVFFEGMGGCLNRRTSSITHLHTKIPAKEMDFEVQVLEVDAERSEAEGRKQS